VASRLPLGVSRATATAMQTVQVACLASNSQDTLQCQAEPRHERLRLLHLWYAATSGLLCWECALRTHVTVPPLWPNEHKGVVEQMLSEQTKNSSHFVEWIPINIKCTSAMSYLKI